jgi:glutathione S-transferase
MHLCRGRRCLNKEMSMLTIWGRRSSFNVQKVMWLVGELDLPHQHIEVGGRFGGLEDSAFLKINPHGRVPVLQDGETAVWESHAILRYLAASFGGQAMWPEDPASRSLPDRWMDWTQASLQPDFLNGVFWAFYRTPEDKRNWPAIRAALARCAHHFGQLEGQLEGRRLLLGDHLTLADISVGTALYRYFELEIDRPSMPNVVRWYHALREREAYRVHVMIPFSDLFGRLDY